MIAFILAGGYAKRLWPLTLNRPKVLLPMAGKLVLDHVIEKVLRSRPSIGRIIVSINLKFQPQFEQWLEARKYSNVELIPDDSRNEYEKTGAVRALSNIASTIDQDFLVLAGDNIFSDELSGLIQFMKERCSPIVALYHAKNLEEAKRGGIAVLNDEGQIVEFIEKPVHPKTTLIGACLYALPLATVMRLREYLELGLPQDEPGRFIEWLHKKEPVYGYMLKGYLWDIGTPDKYKETESYLSGGNLM